MSDERDSILIVYGTQSGRCHRLALQAQTRLKLANRSSHVYSMKSFDPEDLCSHDIVLAITSTYSGGLPPPDAKFFCAWLAEAVEDVRIPKDFLATTRFAVFGLGDRAYEEQFNLTAIRLHESMTKLKGMALAAARLSDVNTDEEDVEEWIADICRSLDNGSIIAERDPVVDVEDMGDILNKSKGVKPQDMVTPKLRSNLTKQGYRIVGSHSGVKMCRWTKAQLRGRGGCYKHTFYGITSYQCMEMTPSLACANKCVFCWRHQTNPVGTEWKWNQNDPETILNGAIEQHRKMINQMKGVPGVVPERFAEAFNVRHCALSLVGEPIMYPEINKLVSLMHERNISTFLVTNAQFPDLIRDLVPVTQLYCSIDAADKETLKQVDRPLFADFWDRFIGSLESLKRSTQRTVFRLTLLKGYNMNDIARYAALVSIGQPCFIEVKGVTFCGNSDKSDLTMKNVPFHSEVRDFCEALCKEIGGDQFELACEHEHSCCVLIASTKLKINDKWHTWIDYDRFHQLAISGEPFSPLDYAAETPSWAVYNNTHKGFDPVDTRFLRNNYRPRPTTRNEDGSAIIELTK